MNSTGEQAGPLFAEAYHLFALNKEDYGKHYHMRSNVESTISAIQRMFGESLRAKTDRATKNELLAEIVADSITCIIGAMHELGIDTRMIGLAGCTNTKGAAHILPFICE
jgi:hypothetical protein